MRNSYYKLFWGFLLVFIEIHIIAIDILPDPIGYYLIFTAFKELTSNHQTINKGKYVAISLIFLSIPSVFIQQNASENTFDLSLWPAYTQIMSLLKLVLVFYVFTLLLDAASTKVCTESFKAVNRLFIIYMAVMLTYNITYPFMMNSSGDFKQGYSTVFLALSFIAEIMFLILLWRFHKEHNPKIAA